MKKTQINIGRYTEFTETVDIKRLNFIADIIQTYCVPGARILDVGCGNGNIAKGIGSLGYEVLGIDFSENAIRYAKSKNTLPNVKFQVCSAEEVTDGDQFDAVICSEVLEHLHEPSTLMATLAKILRPNAIFIATVPNGMGPRELLVTRPVQQMTNSWMGNVISGSKKMMGYSNSTVQSQSEDLTHVQFFTKNAITQLISSHGFDLLQFKHSNFIEKVFPYSMLTRKIKALSMLDNKMVDFLPSQLASGFNTAWRRI